MAEESNPTPRYSLEGVAADLLLEAASSLREDSQVVIVIRNSTDQDLILRANLTHIDTHWLLTTAAHALFTDLLSKDDEEK